MTIDQAYAIARQHHDAGNFAQADQIYRQILAKVPEQADTWHMLGVLLHQTGRTAEGIPLVERAISLARSADKLANLAELLRSAGQIERGIVACQEALALSPGESAAQQNLAVLFNQIDRPTEALAAARAGVHLTPNSAEALRILGTMLLRNEKTEEAVTAIETALKIDSSNAATWIEYGLCHEIQNNMEKAVAAFENATKLRPGLAPAFYHLGRALQRRGRNAKALPCFQRVIELSGESDDLTLRLAGCLEGLNRFDEAIALCRKVLRNNPTHVAAHCIIGISLFQSARVEESEAHFRTAISLVDDADLHTNLSIALVRLGRLEEALAAINRAIEMRPDAVEIKFSKALILYFVGNYQDAAPLFELRWKHPRMDAWRHVTNRPLWDGSPLDGKRILLYAEQGYGDTVMYARYATLVAERGGLVTLEVQSGLRDLISTIKGVDRVTVRGESPGRYDAICPLLTLPGVFNTTVDTIPAKVPYVHTDPVRSAKMKSLMDVGDKKLKVGLVWMGGDFLRENHLRSASLSVFGALASVGGVRFFSLQKGPAVAELSSCPPGMQITNLDPYLLDFADTAAAIEQLDLLIAVDTAVIHVAGALGKPVWALLSLNTAHQWMVDREDTPWYPSMRLFRQPRLGDWPTTLSRVAKALGEFVQKMSDQIPAT